MLCRCGDGGVLACLSAKVGESCGGWCAVLLLNGGGGALKASNKYALYAHTQRRNNKDPKSYALANKTMRHTEPPRFRLGKNKRTHIRASASRRHRTFTVMNSEGKPICLQLRNTLGVLDDSGFLGLLSNIIISCNTNHNKYN